MAIASFARLGFVGGTLALACRCGFVNAFANRSGLANDLPLTGSFSLVSGFALTDRPGFFNIFAIVYVSGLANTRTFAEMLWLVVMIIVTIARTYICRCPIAAIKLIGRRTCEMS